MITIFKDNKDKKASYSTVDKALEGIKKCTLMPKIEKIRQEPDKKKRSTLKGLLPSILWSGKFSDRNDSSIVEHSGIICLDFDHLDNVIEFKNEISKHNFVYAAFISPSGDGLKVLVKIPAIIEKHRGYFRGLKKLFPNVDSSGVNESRICYGSADADVYINTNAIEFTDYIEEPKIQRRESENYKTAEYNNYTKADIALNIIRNSVDGEKHAMLLKASKLMGGYIAGGVITESEGVRLLENEIQNKSIDDFPAAQKTIQKGIEYGKAQPIEVREYEKKEFKYVQQPAPPPAIISEEDEDYSFLATDEDCDLYIEQKRKGTFKQGNLTGFPNFDKYFRFKDAQLDMVLGHDNVGKSVVSWYFAVLDAYFNGQSYIIFSGENKTGGVKAKLMEYYWCKTIENMTDLEYSNANNWVKENFALIKNDESYSYQDMIAIGKKMLKKKGWEKKKIKFIIEPYNVLEKKTQNEHQYDYKAMLDLRLFIRQTGIGVILNVHAATEALRKTYPKEHEYYGYTMPPNKADAEGGGKFPNKADNFIVVHRMADHPEQWMWTEIHIQKIKEMETGGCRTFKNDPFKIRMVKGGCGFEDYTQYNPMVSGRMDNVQTTLSISQPQPITPNNTFLTPNLPYKEAWED